MVVEHREIRYPRIEYRTGTMRLILPIGFNAELILDKYEKWISTKESFIKSSLKKSNLIQLEEVNTEQFKRIIQKLVNKYSKDLGVVVDKVIFRKLLSKWASCSKYGNLTFNIELRYLPKRLINYVVYHEMLHIIERKHNFKFWQMVKEKYSNHVKYEEELFGYWFLINKSKR
jgi:predicted metal-dependent hydrolase